MKHRPSGSSLIQGICLVEACTNKQRVKEKSPDGRKRYDRVCDLHHRMRFGIRSPGERSKAMKWVTVIPNDQCVLCGWNKGMCDRHRLIPENGYVPENIVVLCPNCHRLVTFGIIKLDGKKETAVPEKIIIGNEPGFEEETEDPLFSAKKKEGYHFNSVVNGYVKD